MEGWNAKYYVRSLLFEKAGDEKKTKGIAFWGPKEIEGSVDVITIDAKKLIPDGFPVLSLSVY